MNIILNIITAFIFFLYTLIAGGIIYSDKIVFNKRIFISMIFFIILLYFTIFVLEPFFSIFFLFFIFLLLLEYLYKGYLMENTIAGIIIFSCRIIIKLILSLFIHNIINELYTIFIIDNLSVLFGILIIYIFKDKFRYITYDIKANKIKHNIIIIWTIMSIILVFIFKYQYISITYDTLEDLFMLGLIILLFVICISNNTRSHDLEKYYKEIFEYSKLNEELNLEYRLRVHEDKNKLLFIKSMISSEDKELNEYIDGLLKEYNDNITNYWLSDLSYIPVPGVKNFINYKLIELQRLNTSIEVFVSSDLGPIDASTFTNQKYSDLSTILGVIMDNMIEAVKVQKERLASINIYLEDNKIIGEFVNNFEGKINLDKIYIPGYTTKGREHGVGLPLVQEICKRSKVLKVETSLMDNFFIQKVIITLEDPKNLK